MPPEYLYIYTYFEQHLPKSKVYRKHRNFTPPPDVLSHLTSPPFQTFPTETTRQRDLAPYIPSAKPRSWAHWFPKQPIGTRLRLVPSLLDGSMTPLGYSTPMSNCWCLFTEFLKYLAAVSQQRHWIPLSVYTNPMLHNVWLIFLCWLKWNLIALEKKIPRFSWRCHSHLD